MNAMLSTVSRLASRTIFSNIRTVACILFSGSLCALAIQSSSYAMGFTGIFAPTSSNWKLTDNATPISSTCVEDLPASCVLQLDDTDVTIFSVNNLQTPNNGLDTIWAWTAPAGSGPYQVSLNYSFTYTSAPTDPPPIASIIINGTTIQSNIQQGADNLPFSSTIPTGGKIEFKIAWDSNTTGTYQLEIKNFSAVPAPLPAAGAATAFGYSRRLRRRIKGKVPAKLKQSRTPSYPGAYLNLPPLALQAIPLTFNYQARSVGRFSMVASASSSSGFTSH